MDLLQKKCVPCEGSVPPMKEEEARKLLSQVEGWELPRESGQRHRFANRLAIKKTFVFKNFKEVMGFLVKVAMLAEQEGHHPDIEAHYKEVTLTFTTHAINGLSDNDFIMAAKVNGLH